MDRIALEGMVFYGYHGVHPEERRLGQRFVVDLVAERELRTAGLSDDLADTTSYSDIYDVVREVVEGRPQEAPRERGGDDCRPRAAEVRGGVGARDRQEAQGPDAGRYFLPRVGGDSARTVLTGRSPHLNLPP